MKYKLLILSFILFALISGVFYLSSNRPIANFVPAVEMPISETPTPIAILDVPTDWQQYSAESHIFTFKYPSGMTIRPDADNMITLSLLGPTQSDGTEIYDGIILSFQEASYEENSFKEFVENQYERVRIEPTTQVITELSPVTLPFFHGYEFTSSSLGEFRHIYLDANGNTFLKVGLLVEDPTDQKFEDIANAIVATLRFKERQ